MLIAKLGRAHGLDGGIKAFPYDRKLLKSSHPLWQKQRPFFIDQSIYVLERVKPLNRSIVLKWRALDSIEAIKSLVNQKIFISRAELDSLDRKALSRHDLLQDTTTNIGMLIDDLIGLSIYSYEEKNKIGMISGYVCESSSKKLHRQHELTFLEIDVDENLRQQRAGLDKTILIPCDNAHLELSSVSEGMIYLKRADIFL